MMLSSLTQALRNSRIAILVMAITYGSSLSLGILMSHAGNGFALRCRDSIVARAHRMDPASRADDAGRHMAAAGLDFSRNLFLAAVPDTIGGLTLVLPIALGGYRGWVGGIVSVNAAHHSRLTHWRSGSYYVVTLVLQVSAFVLAGASGLHLGWAFVRKQAPVVGPKWLPLPKRALLDVSWLYLLIVPLFALGSAWEFMPPVA